MFPEEKYTPSSMLAFVKDDGQEVSTVDGKEYITKSVGVDNLRKFVPKIR
jgi:hypothetical protein